MAIHSRSYRQCRQSLQATKIFISVNCKTENGEIINLYGNLKCCHIPSISQDIIKLVTSKIISINFVKTGIASHQCILRTENQIIEYLKLSTTYLRTNKFRKRESYFTYLPNRFSHFSGRVPQCLQAVLHDFYRSNRNTHRITGKDKTLNNLIVF